MNLTSRDRKAVGIGGIIAGAILVIAYLVVPLSRIWFRRGTELGPKLAYVDRLRERVHEQDLLLQRREVLVRRLGSLLGPEASGVPAQLVVPSAVAAELAAAGEQDELAKGEEEDAPTDETAVTASPESTETTVAGEQEEPGNSESDVAPGEEAAVTAGPESTEVTVAGEQEEPGESESDVAPADEAVVTASPESTEAAVAGEQQEPGESESDVAPADEAVVAASPESTEAAVAGEQEEPGGDSGVEAAAPEEAAPEAGRPSSGVSLAAHLERTAEKSGVKIERISPKRQSRGRRGTRHFNSVALQVRLESNVQNLIKLLHALEKGERFVRVEQIQLRRDLKKGDNMQVSLDIVGYEFVTR